MKRRVEIKLIIVLVLLACFVFSCGGGDGGGNASNSNNPPPDTTPPVITLNGANPVTVLAGSTYVDAGATALDDVGGNITSRITTTGLPIDTNVIGNHTVMYNVPDKAGNQAAPVTRTVKVVNIPPPPDTTPPVITLNGANPVTVLAGSIYVDAGATALDDVDGNITSRITTTGLPIDTNVIGNHTVTYNVPDKAGNQAAPVTRMVKVTPVVNPPPTGTISADPTNIQAGQSSMVTWSTTGGTVSISGIGNNLTATGSQAVSPSATTAYTMTVTASDGQKATGSVTVNVTPVSQPPVVRVLYVTPQDRTPRSDYYAAVANAPVNIQGWYKNQLGGKTFSLFRVQPETCRLPQAADYYAVDSWTKVMTDVQTCAPVEYDDPVFVWVLYVDIVHACNAPGRLGAGTSGVTMLPRQDMDGLVGARYFDDCGKEWVYPPDRYIGGLGHELGHAFGLPHPPGCEAGLPTCDYNALMWAGFWQYPNTYLRSEEKQFLQESPFFR
jgi:hypothetical protein